MREACETWSRDQIEAHQLEQLQARIGQDVRSLDDLRALPLTTKADYEHSLERDPPYGDLLGVPREQIARVHFSSGTTARPTPVAWTARDLDRWASLYARLAWSQGVRPGDVHQCLFSYAWFVGGLGATAGYAQLGATVVPGGSADTERQIDTIFRFGTTSIGGTPSFVLHIAEVAESLGRPLQDSNVRHVMVGGEPGGSVEGTRARIEEKWGARCYDGYGCLEFQPIAWECEAQSGGHLVEDFLHADVLDPLTHEPVTDGDPGVLVLTHLDKQACPLVRWWTGDIVVRDRSRCACGRTHARLPGGVRGRADDMLVIRGVNVFPSAVEDLVRRNPGAGSEYRIVLDRELVDPRTGYATGFRLQVEALPGAPADFGPRLAETVHRELKVRPVVEVVEPGQLPRSTHKTKRVVHDD